MIIKDARVGCVGLDNTRLDIFWKWVRPQDYLHYEVHIYKSGAISGPFVKISETYGSVSYTDWKAEYNEFGKDYYLLRVVKRDTKVLVQEVGPIDFSFPADIIAKEIRRRNNLLLKEFIGSPILYYPKLTSGMRCPGCWGESEGQRLRSRCNQCFDTGYVLGYYNPILMYANIHTDDEPLVQNAETDEFGLRTSTAFFSGDLDIQHGDLVLEKSNKRLIVSGFDDSSRLRNTISYRVRLHYINESDIRFKIPLPQDDIFDRFEVSREYSRPYTLNP